MAHRREDVGMLEYIRSLEARVRRLESQNTGVRQNDLRLGNQLVRQGDDDNTLFVTDLVSGNQFTLPQDIPDIPEADIDLFVSELGIEWPAVGSSSAFTSTSTWIAPFDLEFVTMSFSYNLEYSTMGSPFPFTFNVTPYFARPPFNNADWGRLPCGNSGATMMTVTIANSTEASEKVIVTQTVGTDEEVGWIGSITDPSLRDHTPKYLNRGEALWFDITMTHALGGGSGTRRGSVQWLYRATDGPLHTCTF